VKFVLIFVALLYLFDKTNGPLHTTERCSQQPSVKCGCPPSHPSGKVSVLTHFRNEHTRLTYGHLLRDGSTSLYTVWFIPYHSPYALECPDYEEDRCEFNLQGTLRYILGDNGFNLSIILAFLRGIRVDKFIFVKLLSLYIWVELLHVIYFFLLVGWDFWRENIFKIVPVQVPTKLEMWQNYVTFVFVITYVLQAMWPCVVHILIIDHRSLLSMRVPRVCALRSSSGGRSNWGLDSRSGRVKN
jgi:hypothetical protein